MATREEVYCKFGLAAEAGQLFETELGTLLLGISAVENNWHTSPDPIKSRKLLDEIDRHTLGRLLGRVRERVELEEGLQELWLSALDARNRLNHGFFERHNFRIQTNDGRDLMIGDLDALHSELFDAWQSVSALTSVLYETLAKEKSGVKGSNSVD